MGRSGWDPDGSGGCGLCHWGSNVVATPSLSFPRVPCDPRPTRAANWPGTSLYRHRPRLRSPAFASTATMTGCLEGIWSLMGVVNGPNSDRFRLILTRADLPD